jgi:hypothetical protein
MKRVRPLSANHKRLYCALSRFMRGGLEHRLETMNAYVAWANRAAGMIRRSIDEALGGGVVSLLRL